MDEQKVPVMPAKIAAALVKATKAAEAVEKNKRMESAKEHGPRYSFAGADALMTEARDALGGAGLAIVLTGWRVSTVDRRDWNDQGAEVFWSERVVHAAFSLVHEEGEAHALGDFSMPSIPGPGRPVDKADASALTYATGYVMRGLLNLPRVEPGSQVDERDDSAHKPPQAKRAAPAAEEKAEAIMRQITDALSAVESPEALKAWVAEKGAKATRAVGMERFGTALQTTAKRLSVDEGDALAWVARAMEAAKRT